MNISMNLSRTPLTPQRRMSWVRARGFTIVEIMVGLVIGLLTLLAIYQLFAVSEGRRRTVASVSQGQTAGALALFAIEREIRSAGLGFASLDTTFLGCNVKASNSDRSPTDFEFPFQPVEIKDGKELWILTGSSSNMFVGARYSGSSGGEFKMEKSNAGFQPGDVIIGTKDVSTTDCLMMEVTRGVGDVVTLPSGAKEAYQRVEHQAGGSYTNFYTNAAATATRNGSENNSLDSSLTNLGEGWIFNLGPKPTLSVWKISNNQLMRYDAMEKTESNAVAVGQDVLLMAAEYGYDLDGSGKIDQSSEWTATTPAAPNLGRLIAVRAAVLVRTSQFEKDEVTTENPRWANGSKTFEMSSIDNWKHYRYRVYETVIPLRNTIWGQIQ